MSAKCSRSIEGSSGRASCRWARCVGSPTHPQQLGALRWQPQQTGPWPRRQSHGMTRRFGAWCAASRDGVGSDSGTARSSRRPRLG
eukprot:5118802-Alexandrium_andersonii.AAC.1